MTDPFADLTPAQRQQIRDAHASTKEQCRHQYERPGGRKRGDRIVRCHLPAGHWGDHEEADTEVTWPATFRA